jgi:hypothetical protein
MLLDSYPLVAKDILGPLLDYLLHTRAHFGGDLDLFVIFCLVGHRTAEHKGFQSLRFADVLEGAVNEYPSLMTNQRSISESTGIPRETVRRKVAQLVEKGWVAESGSGLRFTPKASRDFNEQRNRLLTIVERNHATVSKLLAGRQQP